MLIETTQPIALGHWNIFPLLVTHSFDIDRAALRFLLKSAEYLTSVEPPILEVEQG